MLEDNVNIQNAYKQMAASLRRTIRKLTGNEKEEAIHDEWGSLLWGTLLCRDLDGSVTTAHFADDAIASEGEAIRHDRRDG